MTRNEFTDAIDEVADLDINREMKIELIRIIFHKHAEQFITAVIAEEDEDENYYRQSLAF